MTAWFLLSAGQTAVPRCGGARRGRCGLGLRGRRAGRGAGDAAQVPNPMQAIARSDIQVPSKRSRSVQARPHGTAETHAARHAVAAHCDVFGARFGCGDYGGAVDDCQGMMPAQKLEPRTILVEFWR